VWPASLQLDRRGLDGRNSFLVKERRAINTVGTYGRCCAKAVNCIKGIHSLLCRVVVKQNDGNSNDVSCSGYCGCVTLGSDVCPHSDSLVCEPMSCVRRVSCVGSPSSCSCSCSRLLSTTTTTTIIIIIIIIIISKTHFTGDITLHEAQTVNTEQLEHYMYPRNSLF
jgi:hypothetical protein